MDSNRNAYFNPYLDPSSMQFAQPARPSAPPLSACSYSSNSGMNFISRGNQSTSASALSRSNEKDKGAENDLLIEEIDPSFTNGEQPRSELAKYSAESGLVSSRVLSSGALSSIEGLSYGNEDVLVSISDCMVHLVDQEASLLITEGSFSLIRLSQPNARVATIIKVGESLSWPLGSDETVCRIAPLRYLFTVHMTKEWNEKSDVNLNGEVSEEGITRNLSISNNSNNGKSSSSNYNNNTLAKPETNSLGSSEILQYGVTFDPSSTTEDELNHLDDCLRGLCVFTEPDVKLTSETGLLADVLKEKPLSGSASRASMADSVESGKLEPMPNREVRDSEFWTRIAPSVDNYQNSTARGIAAGSGAVIRSVLYLADSAKSGIEYTGAYVRGKMKKGEEDAVISPRLQSRMKSVRKTTKMTDNAASGILKGIIKYTGKASSKLYSNKSFQRLVKTVPGEITTSSLAAFDGLVDALEIAGKTVLKASSLEMRQTVSHKYGEEAGGLTKDGLCASGNLIHTAWSGVKLKKAFYPTTIAKNVVVTSFKSTT